MNSYLSKTVELLKNPWVVVLTVSLSLAFVGFFYELVKDPNQEHNLSIKYLWKQSLGKVSLVMFLLSVVVKVFMSCLILVDYQISDFWFRAMGTIVALSFLFSMCLIGTRLRLKWGNSPSPGVYAVFILTLYSITITFIPQYAELVQDAVFTSGGPSSQG